MQKTFQTPSPLDLEVRLPSGEVVIEAAATDETTVRLEGPDDAVSAALVELDGNRLRVEIPERRLLSSLGRRHVDLHVRCPEGSSATVRTGSADVRAGGGLAAADIKTASGDVVLERAQRATVKTASGDIEIGTVDGPTAVSTASGDARVGRSGGDFTGNLVSGDLELGEAAASVTASTVSGDQKIRSVAVGDVRLSSVSGDVEVGVRTGSRVHVDAHSVSGDLSSDLALDDEPSSGAGPTVSIRVKSVSGDVAVIRSHATAQEVHQP
jgi:DUF4097 and DUF4098 domain-containing protein YvlB